MSSRTITLDDRLYGYLLDTSLREAGALTRLREETTLLSNGNMQISPEQGQFMGLLIRLLNAKKTLEVGTFTGYSSISVALALPSDGQMICCDVSEEFTNVARRYWKEAGVADKIELRIGPAIDSLANLLKEGQSGSFDFAFIDADKDNYDTYYECSLELLRPGGVIAIDNVFQHGRVSDPSVTTTNVEAVRALNKKIHGDTRVHSSMLPIGDGLTLALKN